MTQYKVRSLFAELGFQIKNLKKAQEFEDAVENIRAGMERVVSVAKTTAFAITGVATAMTVFQKGAAGNAAELKRTADGLEVNVENYQALRFAYEQLGIDNAETVDSFQKLSDRVEKAAKGSKEYQRGLKLIGVSAKELQKMDMGSAYDTVIKKVAALEEPQKRLSALTVIFGETLARKLSPALAENGELLKDYLNLARETGAVMSGEQVDALAALDFQFVRMSGMLTAVKKQLALALLPIFERTITRVWNWYKANQAIVKSKIVDFAERLSDAVETAANTFKQLNTAVEAMGGWFRLGELSLLAMAAALIGKLGTALSFITTGVKALGAALASAAGLKLAALFGVIVVVGLLLASAFEEIVAEGRGAETLLEDLWANFDELNPILQLLTMLLQEAKLVWEVLAALWENAVLPALEMLKPALYVVAGVIGIVAAAVLAIIVLIAAWAAGMLLLGAILFKTLLALPAILKDILDVFWGFVKALTVGLTPDGVQELKKEFEELGESIRALPGMDWVAERLGSFDLKAGLSKASTHADYPSANRTMAAAGSGGTTNTSNQQTVTVQQENNFNVSGSMDESTARKVSDKAGKASRDAANSINNAARSGNR